MTEPGSGSDLLGVTTRADRDGDHFVINGSKTFISNGVQCDLVVLVAKTDPSEGARGLSLIVVETRDLHGFTRGRNLDKIGMHGQDTAELFFDDVRVPIENLLGPDAGQGFAQLSEQLPRERLIIGVMAIGMMEAVLKLTTEYAKERRAFGKPLMDFQNTRFVLAECATITHAVRVFVDSCIVRLLAGQLDVATAAMIKWWSAEMQCDVVDACLQVFGGYGFMREYPVSRAFVDARAQKIYGGTNEIMKELVARSL
jgi:acyl-CoA dehydrogenase